MKDRDPYLDEADEDDYELEEKDGSSKPDAATGTIDKKEESLRTKIIGDAFRELGQSAKKDRAAAIDSINERIQKAHDKFEKRIEKLFESHAPADVSKDVEVAVAVAVKALRGEMAAMEKERKKDHARLTASLEALESQLLDQSEAQFKAQADAKSNATANPGKWRFTFGRDHLGRIDGEVVATRMTK